MHLLESLAQLAKESTSARTVSGAVNGRAGTVRRGFVEDADHDKGKQINRKPTTTRSTEAADRKDDAGGGLVRCKATSRDDSREVFGFD